ncbi:reverse transcriptase family protein, partial (plasmid) [Staphylococcus nepalensis]
MKQLKKYPIHQCAFYKCRSKKKLASLLKTDLKNLNRLSKSIEQEYYTFNKKRKITAPKKELKAIQKRVLS